ncbi:hypothetical protein J6590_018576 [Homalodisca vitripennis]|nr:hypothetical protein J6590_018576 [Homalodisca vitripennis]
MWQTFFVFYKGSLLRDSMFCRNRLLAKKFRLLSLELHVPSERFTRRAKMVPALLSSALHVPPERFTRRAKMVPALLSSELYVPLERFTTQAKMVPGVPAL